MSFLYRSFHSVLVRAGIFFTLLSLLFWGKLLSGTEVLFHDIFFKLFYPNAEFIRSTIRSFDFPFWNPHIYSGIPFLANMQSALLYPFTYLYVIFDFSSAMLINLLLHTFMAAFFMYLFSRDLNLSQRGSILAGVAFAFNGFLIMHYPFPSQMNSYVWLPLILLFFRRALRKGSALDLFSAALFFSLQIFAGHPQFAFYSSIALAILTIFSQSPSGGRLCNWVRKPILLALLFLFSLLISGIQLLPAVNLILQSPRISELGYDWATTYSLTVKELASMIFIPFWNRFTSLTSGDPHILSFYVGLPILLLSAASIPLFKRKITEQKEFSFGRHKVGLFQIWIPITLISAIGFILALGRNIPFYRVLYDFIWPLRLIRFPAQSLYLSCFGLSLLSGIGLDRLFPKGRSVWWILIICIADLWIFSQKSLVTIDAAFFDLETDNILFLRERLGNYRIFMTPRTRLNSTRQGQSEFEAWSKFKDSLHPNLAMAYGLFDADGIDELRYRRYDRVLAEMGKNRHSPWVDILGIRYILSLWEMPGGHYQLVRRASTLIYENPDPYPVAYFSEQALQMERDHILPYVAEHPDHDFYQSLLVESDSGVSDTIVSNDGGKASVNLIRTSPNRVVLEVLSPRAGWLVLSDSYDEGWRASVNGEERRVLRANYIQRAVRVDAGHSRIIFSYQPPYFLLCAIISLLTLGWMLLLFRRRRKIAETHRLID